MFSPIGRKRIMLENFQKAMSSGTSVEVIAKKSFEQNLEHPALRSLKSSNNLFARQSGPDSEEGNSEDEKSLDEASRVSESPEGKRIRKKRRAQKIYLNQKILEEVLKNDNSALGRGIQKVTRAAAHFSRARDGVLLQGFETKSLNREEFRLMLRKVFSLELLDDEYQKIFELFDTEKIDTIDGSEFLVYFIHLGKIWKDDHHSKNLKRHQMNVEKAKEKADEKAAAQLKRQQEAVDYNYSQEDVDSANEKISRGAKRYVKGHPSAKSIRAFETNYLAPFTFKNLCNQTLDIKLSAKEVGALVDIYDTAKNKTVDSPYFLLQFLREGTRQRHKDRSKQIILTREYLERSQKEHEEKMEEIQTKMETGFDIKFTEEDLERGMEKLRQAAVHYEASHPAALSLDGFCSVFSSPGIFREMIKRTFNCVLPPNEMSAVVNYFDTENNNTVDNGEFLKFFRRASTNGRFAMRSYLLSNQRKANADAEAERERLIKEQWGKLEDKVKYEFTKEEEDSAISKLTDLAGKYFTDRGEDDIKPFKVAYMGPAMWRDMMKRKFFLNLTDGELACFISIFGNAQKDIDCSKFVQKFNSMAFNERSKSRSWQLKLDNDRALEAKRKEETIIEKKRKENEESIDYNFTDEDVESCLLKFRKAAVKHDKNHSGSVNLDALEVSCMPAKDFQELCRRIFRINLAPKELGAIVSICSSPLKISPIKKVKYGFFKEPNDDAAAASVSNIRPDSSPPLSKVPSGNELKRLSSSPSRNSTGGAEGKTFDMLNCNEFMLLFSYLKRTEKHSVFSNRVSLFQQVKKMKDEEHEKIMDREKEQSLKKLQFVEADKDSLMKKLNGASQKFALDNAAYLESLKLFKGPPITASAFRECFFRIFLIRLSFAELGALANTLSPELYAASFLSGDMFLTAFYKLSRIHEKILLGLPVSENINSTDILKLVTDIEPVPVSELLPRTNTAPAGLKRSGSKLPNNIQTNSPLTPKSGALPSPGRSPTAASKQATESPLSNQPETKLPSIVKTLQAKKANNEKKTEELENLFVMGKLDRETFTTKYQTLRLEYTRIENSLKKEMAGKTLKNDEEIRPRTENGLGSPDHSDIVF